MGFSVPNLRFYPLPLYSLFPREPVTYGNSGTLNANTAFELQPTRYPFTSSYLVNQTPTTDRTGDTFYYTVSAGSGSRQANYLRRTEVNNAPEYNTPLSFSGVVNRNFGTGSTPTATLQAATLPDVAPNAPLKYQNYLASLAISDVNMAGLLAQPEFQLRNIGSGLRVTTDGLGHVDNIRIDLSYQGVKPANSPFDPTYAMTNREEILLRESLRGPAGSIAAENNETRVGKASDSNSPNPLDQLLQLINNKPINTQNLLQTLGERNPILDRLAQLQPRDRGLSIAGFEAEGGVNVARQLATSQARLDVSTGTQFQQNIAQLVQGQLSTQAPKAPSQLFGAELLQQIAMAANGRIPLSLTLPAGLQANLAAGSDAARSAVLMGVEDPLSRKGGGGYIPFALGQNTGEQSSGGSTGFSSQTGGQSPGGSFNPFQQAFRNFLMQSGAGNNPFSGNAFGNGQQPDAQSFTRRKPLTFVA